jgi:GntR family transcriptional repressor for pyruvate dehydrogenase complex
MSPAGIALEPLRALPLKEQVSRRLRRLIEDGTLQPGQQLPSERELSDQLQVSRGTVREAVQFLQALGLVDIRHGAGTFVASGVDDPQRLRDEWRTWTRRHAGRIHELLEVRRGLEAFAAELAATRHVEPGLERMGEAVDQMAYAVRDGDVTALVELDVMFHRALCETAGNAALVELADALGTQLLRERAAVWDLPGRARRSLTEHSRIDAAVRAGDSRRARAQLLAHLTSVERDIDAFLSEPATTTRRRRK